MLKVLHNLAPEDSAVAAISKGLFYLDSRALAALLKELHKVGLSNRYSPSMSCLPLLRANCLSRVSEV